MGAGADVVTDGIADGCVGRGLLGDAEARLAEEGVDGLGEFRGEKFSLGIGVEVLRRAGDVERTRGDEGEKLVLVDGEVGFATVVAAEV